MVSRGDTNEVYWLHPIILIRSHSKLDHDIWRLSNLEHLDTGRVLIVNLHLSRNVRHYLNPKGTKKRRDRKTRSCFTDVFNDIHQANQPEESSVDFTHDCFIFLGREWAEKCFALGVVIRAVRDAIASAIENRFLRPGGFGGRSIPVIARLQCHGFV